MAFLLVSAPQDAILEPGTLADPANPRRDEPMEFLCPICGKWTELREHQVFAGTRCRCPRCGGLLLVTSARPFRIEVEGTSEKPVVRVGTGIGQKEENHG